MGTKMSIPAIDIRPDHWQIVQHILRKHVAQYAVWAFGSRVKWTAKEYSDLDLAIITDKPLSLSASAALSDDFSESDLPWKVDVVDWATTSESFRKIIERDKVVVQRAEAKGGIAGEWRESTWGDEVSLEYGKALHCYSKALGKFRVYGSNGPIGWTDESLIDGPRVILGRKGAYRGVEFERRPCWVIDTAYYVVPKTELDTRWLYYAIRYHKLGEIDDGSPIPSTTRAAVYVRSLQIPPIEEQRAIARILGAFDDKIELNRRTNETLEAMARALFKSWFVDFDGVAQEDMQESELGLIPKGWRAGTLADSCELNASKWTDKKHPATVLYIDLGGVSSNRIETTTELAFDAAPSRARLHLREGDTIVGTVRPGNRAFAYIHQPEENLTGSTGFAVLSPKQPHFSSFIYLAATRKEAIERLVNLADGAAYPAVRPSIVAETPCVIATNDVFAEFSGITKPLLERIAQNSQQTATLAALRDALLPRLISGQLRVKQ